MRYWKPHRNAEWVQIKPGLVRSRLPKVPGVPMMRARNEHVSLLRNGYGLAKDKCAVSSIEARGRWNNWTKGAGSPISRSRQTPAWTLGIFQLVVG